MNKYYLVKYYGNYADEFNVYFHDTMTEEELKKVKEIISKTNWTEEEFCFGSNECIEMETEELMHSLNNAKEITEEQYNVLIELGLATIDFGDCLNWDGIIECALEEQEDDETN